MGSVSLERERGFDFTAQVPHSRALYVKISHATIECRAKAPGSVEITPDRSRDELSTTVAAVGFPQNLVDRDSRFPAAGHFFCAGLSLGGRLSSW